MESFRILLLIFLVLCALSVSFSKNLLVSIIIYMSYSLIMSMIWVLLESPDLAITEAAVGAGVTSVLFFITLKRISAIGKEHVEKPDETTREIHTRTWVRRFERYYKEAAIVLGMHTFWYRGNTRRRVSYPHLFRGISLNSLRF